MVVLVLGVLVVTVVLALGLISRLDAGQQVVDGARPAFTLSSLNADQAGIQVLSRDVNTVAPIVTKAPGAVAAGRGVGPRFPHTGALLQALPLAAVSAELPGLEAFLAHTLRLTPTELLTQLRLHSPGLAQALAGLPAVTGAWKHVPGLAADGLTGFDGKPVRTVPELRDYFARLVDILAAQKENFDDVASSSMSWIAPVVLAIGIVVAVFALAMIAVSLRGVTRRVAVASSAVVAIVGVAVVVLVLATGLISRLESGQHLIDALNPAFTAQRVRGDRTGIRMVQTIVGTEGPIATAAGGAAHEATGVVAYAAKYTHTSPGTLLATLRSRFPHAAALLTAIPLTAVSGELARGRVALPRHVAHHLQDTLANLPHLTGDWSAVPAAVTHFSGAVIPVLEMERQHWETLTSTSKLDFVGWLVLALGAIALLYGLLMLAIARTR